MKRSYFFTLTIAAILLLFNSCGGSLSSNKYLGKLPAISDQYQTEIEELEEKADQATDMKKAFKYAKEAELKDDEAEKAIEEYLADFEFLEPIPYESVEDAPYSIDEVKVTGASLINLNIEIKVTLQEDLRNEYNNPIRNLFIRLKALDSEGNLIGSPGVLMSSMGRKFEFNKGDEVVLKGIIRNVREFSDLSKLQSISQEEYEAIK